MNEAIAQVTDKLSGWWTGFLEMLPNLGVALLVIGLFWGLSRLVKNLMDKVLHRSPVHDTAVPIVSRTLSFIVLAVGLVIALGILQLQEAATSLLAGAGIIKPHPAALAKTVMKALARKQGMPGAEELKVPLSLQDGWLYVGPVALAKLPPIRWP